MSELRRMQKEVYQNKIDKGFNTRDVCQEFCSTFSELSEAFEAYSQKKPDLGEELADVVIFVLGLAEILDIDLENELVKKIAKNKQRRYMIKDGVTIRISEE